MRKLTSILAVVGGLVLGVTIPVGLTGVVIALALLSGWLATFSP